MMNFNPHRLGRTPTVNVSAGDISQLLQGGQASIKDALSSLMNVGKLSRGDKVSDLISSGALKDLNEAQARAKIVEATGGGILTDNTKSLVESLLGNKSRLSEQDFRKNERIQEQLFKDKQSQLSEENALKRLMSEQAFRRNERLGSQDFQTQLARDKAIADLAKEKISSQNKEDTFEKKIATGLAENVIKSPNYVEEQVSKVERLFDDDNILWDAELDSSEDKAIVRQAIRDSLVDKKGRIKLSLNDKASVFDAVKEELKKKGLDLDEDFFGNISVVKTKK